MIPSRLKTISPFRLIAISLLIGALLLATLLLFTSTPRIHISLWSNPVPQPLPLVHAFRTLSEPPHSPTTVTQRYYSATLHLNNLGRDTLQFTDRASFLLDVRKSNSTEWQTLDLSPTTPQSDLMPSIPAFSSVAIPLDAAQWRIRCHYRRWSPRRKALNDALRQLLKIQISEGKTYTSQSPVWNLPP